MRRVSTIAAALAGALVTVTACSGAIDTGTGKTAATDAPAAGAPAACQAEGAHIAVLLPNQTNPYYVAMKKGFE
ncbi:hypothetical protein [Buchananella hordeovulneris]|nr:hypothetical protein [Buchananella hordeovulneris]